MIAQPIFDISSLVESAFHQRLYPHLAGRAFEGAEKGAPLRRDFRVGRQARNVDQALCLRDGVLVE
jgi:hypothetical protein